MIHGRQTWLHHFTKTETSLTPFLFIEVPAPSHENEWRCRCLLWVMSFASFYVFCLFMELHINMFCCLFFPGNCGFDDQNMEISGSFSPLPFESASTLEICKDLCHNYQDGAIQCWAIMYQSAANKCYMYASIYPQQYLSTKTNKNKNKFYAIRECFSCTFLWYCVVAKLTLLSKY